MMRMTWKISAMAAISIMVAQPIVDSQALAQATYDGQGKRLSGKTHVDRAIGKCVAAVLIGGIVGGIAKGEKGALIGAGAGGVVCALIMRGASNKDKARVRDAQLAALVTNANYTDRWTTDDGAIAEVAAAPLGDGAVLMANGRSLQCRRDDTCLIGTNWYPRSEILAQQAPADAPKVVKASFASSSELLCRKSKLVYNVNGQAAASGDDISCLVGDTWVTSSEFKKQKINDEHIVI